MNTSPTALEFAQYYIASSVFPRSDAQRSWGYEVRFGEELLDLYQMSPPDLRRKLVPFLDPDFYQPEANSPFAGNPLADFFENGLPNMRNPHPLISLEYMRFLRADLFENGLTPQLFFAIFQENLVDPGPHFDISHYRSSASLGGKAPAFLDFLTRGAQLGHSPNPYFDLDFYRARYPDAPDDNLEAVCSFVRIGDAELRIPCEGFDSVWYRDEYSTDAHVIAEPLTHFLRWGRFAKHKPLPEATSTKSKVAGYVLPRSDYRYQPDPLKTRTGHGELITRLRRNGQVLARDPQVELPSPPATIEGPAQSAAIAQLAFASATDAPRAEAIVLGHRALPETLTTLRSLSAEGLQGPMPGPLSVRVAADPQADGDTADLRAVDGLTLIEGVWSDPAVFEPLWQHSRAEFLVLIQAGATLQPGALERLLAALRANPDAVAATPVLVTPDGLLHAAGGLIAADGTPLAIDRGQAADTVRGTQVRSVGWGPAQCLVIRHGGDPAPQIGGFQHPDCRDAALSMQLRGPARRIIHVPTARALCPTPIHGMNRMQHLAECQKLLTLAPDQIEADTRTRVLAHYEPTFYPVPETDIPLQKGYTDWWPVDRVRPGFVDHYQPHTPADLGHYDTRLADVLEDQKTMARRYGVTGFVVDYYNFNGRRFRFDPIEQLIASQDGFGHCLCWANGDFFRTKDGVQKRVFRQIYDEDTIDAVLDDAVLAARSPGAIMVDGLPLFVVRDPTALPDPEEFAETARARFAKAGFKGLHLAGLEQGARDADMPETLHLPGFDALIEQPPSPKQLPRHARLDQTTDSTAGHISDYAQAMEIAQSRPRPALIPYPSVYPGWDQAALGHDATLTLHGARPNLFQAHIEAQLDRIDDQLIGDNRLLFVDGWNRWASGAHLEPDRAFGHSWLQALDQAVQHRNARPEPPRSDDTVFVLHAYYMDVLDETLTRFEENGLRLPMFITTPEDKAASVHEILAAHGRDAEVCPFPNHGRDVLPFMRVLPRLQERGYRYVLKMHTKKSPHRDDGDVWREELYRAFADRDKIERLVNRFDHDPTLGIVGPASQILPLHDHLEDNYKHMSRLVQDMGSDLDDALRSLSFVAGTMFFARLSAFVPLQKLGLTPDDFETEAGQVDGTIAHAIERVTAVSAAINGRRVRSIEGVLGETTANKQPHNMHR